MLNVLQWKWQSVYSKARDDNGDSVERIVGIAASGLDLAAGLVFRLQKDTADTASQYQFQSAAWHDLALRPQNQCALALLQDWLGEPDDLGDAWWKEFDRDLRHHRLSFPEAS